MALVNVGELKKFLEGVPDEYPVVFEHEDEPNASYGADEVRNENGFIIFRSVAEKSSERL